MKRLRFSRFYCICVLLLTGFWVGSLSGFAQPPDGNPHTAMPSLYSAVLDYEAGWLAGTNPNGVWSYGWSSDLTTPITLFWNNWLYDSGVLEQVWDDPDNNYGGTPKVSRNSGGDYDDGNVSYNAGRLALHCGVGNTYAHVIFTAPTAGKYSIAATFYAQQHNIYVDIHVLVDGKAYFSDTITSLGESHSFAQLVQLRAGQTVDFAVGPNGNPELHPGYTGLEAVVARIHP
jgi:hypothetical protein